MDPSPRDHQSGMCVINALKCSHHDRPISIGQTKHGLGVRSQRDTWRHEKSWIFINVIVGQSRSDGHDALKSSSHCGDAWIFQERRILIERVTKGHQDDIDRAIGTAQPT